MAQRLLLRRFLASVISRKPPQGPWAPLTSRALQPPQGGPGDPTVTPSQARSLYTTRVCTTTFNIQDGTDFQDRVVNSETPVVVDFHAQWCGPCKILGPRLEKVVAKQHGKVVMAKVDIDDHTDLAIEYEVCNKELYVIPSTSCCEEWTLGPTLNYSRATPTPKEPPPFFPPRHQGSEHALGWGSPQMPPLL
nr:thioredoxin, mitochondrial isoform X1 [Desmodus rotundus]XP_045043047.2 thioredoxin, mitochondrial isoform X1 [Desmodus rotundus]XP_045043048.2 thioredoxin, mitochondrial isoform X1 [Desmodus rotundus]